MSRKKTVLYFTSVLLVFITAGFAEAMMTAEQILGRFLFFDMNLSNPAGKSCMSCHYPTTGFSEPVRKFPVSGGAVVGSFGTRNAPSAAYASFSPAFHSDPVQGYIGGQFWDGRAATPIDQAKDPFLNPLEMNNTKEGVITTIRAANYSWLFPVVYGGNPLSNVETAYNLVARALAAFEKTNNINRFTSKFDYYLKGQVALTQQELNGLGLFEDPAKGNCAKCHPTASADGLTPPLFTDFSYDNLGVPKNTVIETLKGAPVPVDLGLGAIVGSTAQNGKFKVPTLRNIAKTSPYAHNGYFKSLRNIVHFYNTRDVAVWPAAEVPDNVNNTDLGNLGLTLQEEDDIVAFLLTLTDGFVCTGCTR